MALDQAFVGRVYPPTAPYTVSRAKVAEFADAIGDDAAAYRDVHAAAALGHNDVIAPPTFANIVTLEAAYQVVHDPALGLAWDRVVHGDQRFVYERPLVAGDEITVVVTVALLAGLIVWVARRTRKPRIAPTPPPEPPPAPDAFLRRLADLRARQPAPPAYPLAIEVSDLLREWLEGLAMLVAPLL